MSGTSMAAPQVTGMAALMAQVYRENGMADKSGISARHLTQSLLMSTALPLYEEASGGNYYSLLNQGAGLARVDLAFQADSFIKVEGQEDYKVKAELGDDPQRTGIYEFEFSINNLTDREKVYALEADLFRQDVFEYQPDSDVWLLDNWTTDLDADVTFYSEAMSAVGTQSHDLNADGRTNAADADFLLEYLVGNENALAADGDLSGDGKVDSYDAHLLLAGLSGDTVIVPANGSASIKVRMALTGEARAELDAMTPKGTYVEAFVYARGIADAEGETGTVHAIPVLAFYGNWSEPSMFDRGTLLEHIHLAVNTAPYLYEVVGPYGNSLGIDYSDGSEYYYGGNPILDDDAYIPARNAFNSVDASRITEQGFTLIRGAPLLPPGGRQLLLRGSGPGRLHDHHHDHRQHRPEILDIDVSQVDGDKLTVKVKDNEYVAAVAMLNASGTRMFTATAANQTTKNTTATLELDLSDIFGTEFLVAAYDYARNMRVYELEVDLGEVTRDYFTAYDSATNCYVSVDWMGQVRTIADTGLPVPIRASEYVGGYVFSVTDDNSFCVASDADLSYTQRICQLDPDRQWMMTFVNDLAYNKADDKLYCQFYSQLNQEMVPYLATIDMESGAMNVLGEMPRDLNTLAIDGQGNFYSAGFDSNVLYTYTVDQNTGIVQNIREVGTMGYYYSSSLSSMTWDHNEDKLYWAFPNTLLQINPKTAEVTLLGYHAAMLSGIYTRPEVNEGRFDPVDIVERVELSVTDTRILKGTAYTLEASVWPWNASNRAVIWSSSDPNVATVDEFGRVMGRNVGECVITATSVMDPSVSGSCTIEVFEHNKTLQSIIWDEAGDVWMSEFETEKLPSYKKLSASSLGQHLAAATLGQDGNIYAASLDESGSRSDLYKLDPVTFAPTKIGISPDGYVDLAPAPGRRGNSLMAVYGGNVLNVDADTGDYYNWYYMFSYSLVGIAYVGTQDYQFGDFDTQVDWYFIIDRMGYVYLMGFLEQDGKFYYLEHERMAPGGIYTKLDVEMETAHYGSAYFDGEMLYYSAYLESKNHVTLYAIDVAGGTRICYELGTFDDDVWPVAGLMELDGFGNYIDFILDGYNTQTMALPTPVEEQAELKGIRSEKADGTLHNAAAPLSFGQVEKETVRVSITVPSAAFELTNGTLWVEYDPAKLELKNVQGRTDAFAWKQIEAGKIAVAFAEAVALANDAVIANLDFAALTTEETLVEVIWGDYGQEHLELVEQITVKKPFENPFMDLPDGTFYHDPVLWAVENGITAVATDTTFNPDGECQRAQGSPDSSAAVSFNDVQPGQFYSTAVAWAVEHGITNGISATEFGVGGICNRAQVVTFLYRTMT